MWVVGIVALMVLPIIVVYLFVGGEIFGEEFSPDDFSRREFSYNVMPLFKVTLRGIQHQNTTSAFEQSFVTGQWITVPTETKRWHLIYDSGSHNDSPDFDASILTSLLRESTTDGANLWQTWNDTHPKLGKILWPAVAKLARYNLYWATPDILQAAKNVAGDDDPHFESLLDERVATAFADQADILHMAGDPGKAIEFYTIAIETLPTRDAFLGRSGCFAELGEMQKSQQDVSASALVENE
jgi:hypothetical protein